MMKWHDEICAMARGEVVEFLNCEGIWCKGDTYVNPLSQPSLTWRIKPTTFMLNGEEIPMPVGGDYTIQLHRNHAVYCQRIAAWNTAEDRDKVYDAIVKVLTP